MSSLGLAWTVVSSRVATVIGALARSVSPQRLGASIVSYIQIFYKICHVKLDFPLF